ncbi:DUF5391 family protein [Shouchella patagoniensis]|uniref:DUF5391 family protein n=1 Tax=Shouchella patagoniensis TaxID=228576 RepID=UPI000995AB99|nr:DUF5391 family protein [Shouchella patagoniensis]
MTNQKKKVFMWSVVSMFLFCLLTVLITLTPLAEHGQNSNQFGDFGMWSGLAMTVVSYAGAIVMYLIGGPFFKVVYTIVVSLGIFINGSLLAVFFAVHLFMEIFTPVTIVAAAISACLIVVNFICIFAANKSERSPLPVS